jgi:hypothetical protein
MSPGGRLRRVTIAAAIAAVAACASKNECVTGLPAECSPLYPPTFDNVFSRTRAPTCAQPGGICHATAGVQGGLLFVSTDSAYAMLLGRTDGVARVIPGNAACSPLVERIESSDPHTVMPPEAPLSAAERCAVRQWIDAGAQR